jgi:hypothetical protein
MNKRGGGAGLPMSERVRVTQARSVPEPPAPDCPARHCWVGDAVDREGVKRPGLLLEWRQGRGGWEGRVVYVARLRADRWVAVEEWLPADRLTER